MFVSGRDQKPNDSASRCLVPPLLVSSREASHTIQFFYSGFRSFSWISSLIVFSSWSWIFIVLHIRVSLITIMLTMLVFHVIFCSDLSNVLDSSVFMASQFDWLTFFRKEILSRKLVLRSGWLAVIPEEKRTEKRETPSSTIPVPANY